jgi:nucleoside-diphosphate-sugar epimerase
LNVRVLVTGAAGYVGGAVVRALLAAGYDPVAMTHRVGVGVPDGVEQRTADLLDPGQVRAAVQGVDAVCHLAALTRARDSWDAPLDYYAVNVTGTLHLLGAMGEASVGALVFASTASIYGTPEQQPMAESLPDSPPHPYAGSKAAAESVVAWEARRAGLSAMVLRLFNAAGGRDPDSTRIVPRVVASAADGTAFAVNGDGSAVRDYMHVDDAAAAFVAALKNPVAPGTARTFNIGSGVATSVMDVISAAERATGRRIKVEHRPPAAEPRELVCQPARAHVELDWRARRSDLDVILADAWNARG